MSNIKCGLHNRKILNICKFAQCRQPSGICQFKSCQNLHLHTNQQARFTNSVRQIQQTIDKNKKYAQEIKVQAKNIVIKYYQNVIEKLNSFINIVNNQYRQQLAMIDKCIKIKGTTGVILERKFNQVNGNQMDKFLKTNIKSHLQTKLQTTMKQFEKKMNELSKIQALIQGFCKERQNQTIKQIKKQWLGEIIEQIQKSNQKSTKKSFQYTHGQVQTEMISKLTIKHSISVPQVRSILFCKLVCKLIYIIGQKKKCILSCNYVLINQYVWLYLQRVFPQQLKQQLQNKIVCINIINVRVIYHKIKKGVVSYQFKCSVIKIYDPLRQCKFDFQKGQIKILLKEVIQMIFSGNMIINKQWTDFVKMLRIEPKLKKLKQFQFYTTKIIENDKYCQSLVQSLLNFPLLKKVMIVSYNPILSSKSFDKLQDKGVEVIIKNEKYDWQN